MSKDEQPAQPAAAAPPATDHVHMIDIVKHYGATKANDGIDFDLAPGEIHALLGENGAGKTTLMNILFGHVQPDAGTIRLGERVVQFGSPHDALERGIGMVHQHFMLVPNFTVAENVVLGSDSSLRARLSRREIEQSVAELAERVGLPIDPRQRIHDLPVDTQQRVEILKLLYRGARVLILDEPTSSLGPAQIDALFDNLRSLREQGNSVVLVTHKLREVMAIADRVTVLRQGKTSTVAARGSFDEQSLAVSMTGQELREIERAEHDIERSVLLTVESLVVESEIDTSSGEGDRQRRRFLVGDLIGHHGARVNAVDGVSLTVHSGEVLGVAGVEGNGQRQLVDALAGVIAAASGRVSVDGAEITHAPPRARHEAGLGIIPEDRQGWGLLLDMTVAENLAVASISAGEYTDRGLLQWRRVRDDARQLLEAFDVRPPDPDLKALNLSGGNQQKVVLARELARQPKVLVAANPTHGLDVGATEFVRRKLIEVRDAGNAILLVSHDLDELFELADRVIVLYRGRVLYEAPIGEVGMNELALAMAGTTPGRPDAAGASVETS